MCAASHPTNTSIIGLLKIKNDSLDTSPTSWYEGCFAYKQCQCCNSSPLSPYMFFFLPQCTSNRRQEDATPPQNIRKQDRENKRSFQKKKNSATSYNKVLWECWFYFKRASELEPFPQCHLLGHTALADSCWGPAMVKPHSFCRSRAFPASSQRTGRCRGVTWNAPLQPEQCSGWLK